MLTHTAMKERRILIRSRKLNKHFQHVEHGS
jgi:hypothetical protein